MNNSIHLQLLFFISLLLFCHYPTSPVLASAVPVTKTVTQKKYKKRFKKQKKKLLKHLKQESDAGTTAIMVTAFSWYPISIVLLILALVFMINPLLIISIILLCLPVLAFIILIVVLLIDVSINGFSLC